MKRVLFLSTLIVLTTVFAVAQTERVLHIITGTATDTALSNILTRAIRVEIVRAGLFAVAYDGEIYGDVSQDAVEQAAAATLADYILLFTYMEVSVDSGSIRATQLEMELTAYSVVGQSVLYTSKFVSPVDLDLDSRVAAAFRKMIGETGIGGERQSIAVTESVTQPETAAGSEPGETAPTPRRTPAVTSNPVITPEPIRVAQAPPPKGFGVSVKGAAVIIVGEAGDFFRYGYNASLIVDYRLSFSQLGITAGIRTGFMQIFPAEGIIDGQVYVVSIGPDVGIGTVERTPVRLSFHVAGGPAVLMAKPVGSELLAKLVPFASAGIEAVLGIGTGFSLGLEVDYLVVFEDVMPVMGLTPSIVIGLGP